MSKLQAEPRVMLLQWCETCDTQHSLQDPCPGRLVPVEPERHGWRINVDTNSGIDAYGVLVVRCTVGWRARILTYPNVLWLVPGGRHTIKFLGSTGGEAEVKAADYVKAHCKRKGYQVRPGLSPVHYSGVDPEGALGRSSGPRPTERKIRFLPVHFGVGGATEPGETGNLSETGMFIITDTPVALGTPVFVALRVEGDKILHMSGEVVWMSKQHHVGRSPGMGLRLHNPTVEYLEYVSRLA